MRIVYESYLYNYSTPVLFSPTLLPSVIQSASPDKYAFPEIRNFASNVRINNNRQQLLDEKRHTSVICALLDRQESPAVLVIALRYGSPTSCHKCVALYLYPIPRNIELPFL